MSIDYMREEMRANIDARPFEGDEFTVGFSVGWRAACEAMQTSGKWAKVPVMHDVGEFYQDPQPAPDWRAACVVEVREMSA
jgi:hypothetical protein